ncbi:hypothetical protein [Neolewinella persica]|uniref:hypothetical protein n=1 Tax=Neolewinella persica TaxID=70998 RepID=UPI000364A2F0|nr:hypothetical protein [Neolewinella persica]
MRYHLWLIPLFFCCACATIEPSINDAGTWQQKLIDERLQEGLSKEDIAFVTAFLTGMCACTEVEGGIEKAKKCTEDLFTELGFDLEAIKRQEVSDEDKRKLKLLSPMAPPTGTCPE